MNEKKEVLNIRDFTDLFLTRYSQKKGLKVGNVVSFSPNFKEILYNLIFELDDGISFSNFKIFDENNDFMIDEFVSNLCISQIKYAWADPLRYNPKTNELDTQIEPDNLEECYSSNLVSNISKIDFIVEEFIKLQEEYTKEYKREYITLSLDN